MISLKKIAENTEHAPVSDCPMTRQSHGIVRMSPDMIAQLAAAVHDADEWAIVLQGTRAQRGYDVTVTGYRVPEQTRSSGHVELPPMDLEAEDVGVIHSHHRLGAFFSTTDVDKLNPRFPVSIVIASKSLQYLGFDYRGTGKVTLPCGAGAEVDFFIQPTEGPVVHEVVEVAHKANDLGKCTNYVDKPSDTFHVHYVAACGLGEPEVLRVDAFGKVNTLLDQVKVLARPQLTQEQWMRSGSHSLVGKVTQTHTCAQCQSVCNIFSDVTGSFAWCNKCIKRIDLAPKVSAKKPGIKCSKCKASLKLTKMTKGPDAYWCHRCGLVTEPPTVKEESSSGLEWLESLIPSRFKRGDDWCRECFNDAQFCICVADADLAMGLEDTAGDMYICNVCGKYDPFEDWECGNCNRGVFCYDCNEGHDERFECRKEALV